MAERYTLNGLSLTLPQWAHLLGVNVGTLRWRLDNLDWPIERALLEPVNDVGGNKRPPETYRHKNRTQTLRAWAEEAGIPHATLWKRLNLGWTFTQALSTPVKGSKKPRRNHWREGQHSLTHAGRTLTFKQWAEITGIRADTLRARVHVYGWTHAEAITLRTGLPRLRTLTGDELSPIRPRTTTTGGMNRLSPFTWGPAWGGTRVKHTIAKR